MSEHQHQQITPGCYRCDLNLDELRDFLRDQFALGGTSGSDPLYDDVHEAWEAFDGSMEQLLAAEKARAWREGYDEGVQRGIGLERARRLLGIRHELGPIPQNPYAKGSDDGR